MRPLILSTVIALLAFATQAQAGDKLPRPAQDDVRKSVARALPFVEKDGLAWINKRNCMSCHVVTFMLWAHNEAQAHGIAVDKDKVAEWTKWSLDKSVEQRVFFKLNDKALQTFPAPLQPKLTPLVGEDFRLEIDLLTALDKALTPEELKEHRPTIVKKAALPRGAANDGGGLDTLGQLFLARTALPARLDEKGMDKDAAFYEGAAALLVGMQDADGTWRAGGQLPSRRWSKATANQTTTMWTILALTTYNAPTPAVKKSLDKAHAIVKKPQGDGHFEWIVARLLYEERFGTAEQKAAMKQQLLKRQNADGGWSTLPDGKSEAFSTGQGLYALRAIGISDSDDIIRRGQKYLLDTQNLDGSWTVSPALTSNGGPDRLKKLEPIWRNWGSSWAVIGLSKSLAAK